MTHKHKKRRAPRAHHRRRNAGARRHHRIGRRRNQGGRFNIGHLLTNSVFIIAGAVGSKLLTQAVLGGKNTGVFGYLGNAGATAAIAWGSHLVTKKPDLTNALIAGGAVQIVLRLITDFTPFGKYTAQIGMGDYQVSHFVVPQRYVDALNSAEVEVPAGWGPGMVAAGPAAGVGSLYDGRTNDGLYG